MHVQNEGQLDFNLDLKHSVELCLQPVYEQKWWVIFYMHERIYYRLYNHFKVRIPISGTEWMAACTMILMSWNKPLSRWSDGVTVRKRTGTFVPLITCHALILLWNCLKLCFCVLHREMNVWDKFEIEI
jgi:hypothetical protein